MTKKSVDEESWLRPLPKEFANSGMSSRRRMIFASIIFVVLAGFSVLIWLSYTSESDDMGPVPVIRADNSVIKEKPNEPGGKEILYQDKEVFDRVDNLKKDEESILAPSSEIPLKRPVAELPIVEEPLAVEEETPAAVAEQPAPKPVSILDLTPAAAPVGTFMVQIGAFAEKNKAEAFWTSVKTKNNAVMARLNPSYMHLDQGAKGSIYRVRGGMIGTRKAADDICAALKSNNQNCIVVTN